MDLFIYFGKVENYVYFLESKVIGLEWICNILCFPVFGCVFILFSTNVMDSFIKLGVSKVVFLVHMGCSPIKTAEHQMCLNSWVHSDINKTSHQSPLNDDKESINYFEHW